jgi:hypothetical protein
VNAFYKDKDGVRKFEYEDFNRYDDYAFILRNFLVNLDKKINIDSDLSAIQTSYYRLKVDLFRSMVSNLSNDGNVAYDIDSVLKYKGHVFMSPYDLLMSTKESLDDKKFPCKICEYEKDDWNQCEECKHIGGEYYKMQKSYLSDVKIADLNEEDVLVDIDSKRVKQYKEATREIATLDLGLSCVSIEHTINCRRDMHMSVQIDDKIYMQRIFPDEEKWNHMRAKVEEKTTRFDVVVYPTVDGEASGGASTFDIQAIEKELNNLLIEEEYYSDN